MLDYEDHGSVSPTPHVVALQRHRGQVLVHSDDRRAVLELRHARG